VEFREESRFSTGIKNSNLCNNSKRVKILDGEELQTLQTAYSSAYPFYLVDWKHHVKISAAM